MLGYWTLVALVMPVFAVIAAGAGARRIGWLPAEAEESLLKLVVNLLYPCLIFSTRTPKLNEGWKRKSDLR